MSWEDEIILRLLLAMILTLVSLVDDLRRYRISNKIIVGGFLLQGFLLILDVALQRPWDTFLLGGLVTFAIMTVVYMLGGVGAGDVKLLYILGAMTGVRIGMHIMIGALLVGGIVGVTGIFWKMCKVAEVAVPGGDKYRMHGFHYTIAIALSQGLVMIMEMGRIIYA